MRFNLVENSSVASCIRSDEELMQQSVLQGPLARIWQANQSLVVPRTYASMANFNNASAILAQAGWPVLVRHSGGGVVPQGGGIINISLAYAINGRPLDHSDTAYSILCNIIAHALKPLGIQALTQAVEGSFCDGRFNLACIVNGVAKKIVGTAQLWRRHKHPYTNEYLQTVLVHALVLVHCDTNAITQQANTLETLLGNTRRYQAEKVTSIHEVSTANAKPGSNFINQVIALLTESVHNYSSADSSA